MTSTSRCSIDEPDWGLNPDHWGRSTVRPWPRQKTRTHIHNGKPTTPIEPGRSSGTIPIVIARNSICSTIDCATTAGSTGAAGPAGIEADQNSPNGFATPGEPIRHE